MPAALLIMQAKDIDFMDDEATQTKKSDFRLLFFGSTVNLLILYQSEICAECVCTVRMSRMYVERRMNGEKKDIHSFHRYCDLVITMHDVQSDQRCVLSVSDQCRYGGIGGVPTFSLLVSVLEFGIG